MTKETNLPFMIENGSKLYFGSKATTRETPTGNIILKVYNTDVLKIMTTGRVEVTHYLPDLLPFTLKAINHALKIFPNNLMDQVNKKDLTTKELFQYKKKVKKKKKKVNDDIEEAIKNLPF